MSGEPERCPRCGHIKLRYGFEEERPSSCDVITGFNPVVRLCGCSHHFAPKEGT